MYRCSGRTKKNRRCLNKKVGCDFCHIHNNDLPECSICYETMGDKESYVLDKCNHKFHYDCVNTWLLNKDNCPLCRTKITDQEYVISIEYALKKDVLISVAVYTYPIHELDITDKLDFLEYINVFFQDITYCDSYTWSIILEYIEATPEIYEIFNKIKAKEVIKLFKKYAFHEHFKSYHLTPSVYCFET